MTASGWQVFVEVPGKAPIELPAGESVIGRSRASVVQIAESTVSRQHAVFVVEPGNVRLKDLGSSNGTYVNGKRVDGSIDLADGDKVVVGEAELVIRILAPLGPAEATQRLSLPPLGAPPVAGATVVAPPLAPPPAPTAAPASPPSFHRTPTGVEAPPPPSLTVPPMPPMSPASPMSPTAPPRPAAPGRLAPDGGELLPSIQEIEKAPVPPPARRAAPVAQSLPLAGFWIRVAAALLDAIPAVVLAVLSVVFAMFVSSKLAAVVQLLQVAYGLFLVLVMPALKGTTPGKSLLKLAILSDHTVAGQGLGWPTALLRLAGHLVCSMTFGLGYLLVAFTAQKQGLHDLIAKTRVVRRVR